MSHNKELTLKNTKDGLEFSLCGESATIYKDKYMLLVCLLLEDITKDNPTLAITGKDGNLLYTVIRNKT